MYAQNGETLRENTRTPKLLTLCCLLLGRRLGYDDHESHRIALS